MRMFLRALIAACLLSTVLLSAVATAAEVAPIGRDCPAPLRSCNAGQAACVAVAPVVDSIIVTGGNLAGNVGAGIVKTVLLSSGVSCFPPGPGSPCPFFRSTPLGPLYFLPVVGVGYAADCLYFPSTVGTVAEWAGVKYLGGGCGAGAVVYAAGAYESTPYVYWFCV